MLKSLHIRNYAIIEEIRIQFEDHLTVITGETGAGKSILIGALSLILGDRADSQVLRNPDEKCIVEATFDIRSLKEIEAYLMRYDFDLHPDLLIRREIVSQGKSRVFVNDTPTTLAVLIPLGAMLIDLHRQFDTLELQKSDFQLNILDELAGNQKVLQGYQSYYQDWYQAKNLLEQRMKELAKLKQEMDYQQFLLKELKDLNLKPNELEEIESELQLLTHSEGIKANLQKANYMLHESEEPVLLQLKQLVQLMDQYHSHSNEIRFIRDRLQSSFLELKDIQQDLHVLEENTFFDPSRIDSLTQRLNEGNRLLAKHHVSDTDGLLKIQEQLRAALLSVHQSEEEESLLKEKMEDSLRSLKKEAEQLSQRRRKQTKPFETKMKDLLKRVGMPNASLQVQIDEVEFNTNGIDRVEFLFDANRSGKWQPLTKVASGGELSRLMLSIKSLLANMTHMPTLIFDEIDSGISGETALQVGQIMKELAEKHQLITITHLPQMAGKAQHHLYIYKEENKSGKITTRMRKLDEEERIEVLAEMLSGKSGSEQSKAIAKDLMN